jgi:hypothetical protein
VAQNDITVGRYGHRVYIDPGVYVTSLGSALQFDVQRASYTKPLTISEVIHLPNGSTETRPLPASILHGFSGLRNFLYITLANSSGKIVATQRDRFCPDVYDRSGTARAAPAPRRTRSMAVSSIPSSWAWCGASRRAGASTRSSSATALSG